MDLGIVVMFGITTHTDYVVICVAALLSQNRLHIF